MFRPLLFIIYINNLDNGVKRKLSKFADDTKLGGEVDSRGGGEQIQESIDTCRDWAKDWQMEFNLSFSAGIIRRLLSIVPISNIITGGHRAAGCGVRQRIPDEGISDKLCPKLRAF